MKKLIISHMLAAYLGAGVLAGGLLSESIPALNIFGVAYVAATWPVLIYCAPVSRGCNPMRSTPDWMQRSMFTFQ